MDATLQADLECFYDQECLNTLQTCFTPCQPIDLSTLDSSSPSIYIHHSTIGDILNELMIEEWNASTTFKHYYNECAPKKCTYIPEARNNAIYIMTTLIGLVGGLLKMFPFTVPRLVQIAAWITRRFKRRDIVRVAIVQAS